MSKTLKDPKRVITGVCRSTFMFCTELQKNDHGTSIVKSGILIPKKDKKTLKLVRDAITAAAIAKFGKNRFKEGRDGYPLRDIGQEREDDTLPDSMQDLPDDHYLINATGYKLPGLVDEDGDEVDKDDHERREEILVSGYYFRFSVTFKGFDVDKNSGVRCVLNNIKFIKEGERFDGGVNAQDEDWGDDDDDDEESSRSSRRSRQHDDDDGGEESSRSSRRSRRRR